MIYFIIGYVVQGILFGYFTMKIASDKGYSESYFWLGFFIGIFGVVIAACLTDQTQTTKYAASDVPASPPINKEWTCAFCGAKNPDALSYCFRCRRDRKTKAQNCAVPESWTCACGTENDLAANFCKHCGSVKPGYWQCAKCSQINAADALFCPACGEKRKDAPGPLPAETPAEPAPAQASDNVTCAHCGKTMPRSFAVRYGCPSCGSTEFK